MEMYHWHSSWLASYSTGDIVVMALTVDEARDAVRARFDDWLREERSWLDPEDPEDDEDIAELRARMERDLAADPTTERVLLIRGGE